MKTGDLLENQELSADIGNDAITDSIDISGQVFRCDEGVISPSVPDWYFHYLNFTELSHSESWEAPKPWSPKPLTPTRENQFQFPDVTFNSRLYGSPQKNWTPPKLPACARHAPCNPAPSALRPRALHSTPAPPGPAGHVAPPAGKDTSSPASAIATPSPRRSTSDTSGYSSNSSGFLGFSPPSLALVNDDLDDEAISLIPIGSPSAKDWHLYSSILGMGTSPERTGQNGGQEQEVEDDITPRAQATPFSDVSDNDIIYEGTSYLERRSTLSPTSADILLYSPPEEFKRPKLNSPRFSGNVKGTSDNTPSLNDITSIIGNIEQTNEQSPEDNDQMMFDTKSSDIMDNINSPSIIFSPAMSEDDSRSTKQEENIEPSKSDGGKPKEPYIALISKILLENAEKKMILQDIYDTLQEKYSYFKTAETSWRNVVRHNLSINECFIKAGRASSGRGFYWAIHPACVDMFKSGDFRRREAKRLVQRSKENKVPSENFMATKLERSTTIPISNRLKQYSKFGPSQSLSESGYMYSFPTAAGYPRSVLQPAQISPYGMQYFPQGGDHFSTNFQQSTFVPQHQSQVHFQSRSAPS